MLFTILVIDTDYYNSFFKQDSGEVRRIALPGCRAFTIHPDKKEMATWDRTQVTIILSSSFNKINSG